jgi:PIN domain nuclease of toxin-antitoxin system
MNGILLDTHALLWLGNGLGMLPAANRAIIAAQRSQTLFASPISAWEIGVSNKKRNPARRPPLGNLPPDIWFRTNLKKFGIRLAEFSEEIACESAEATVLYGSGDPGDCFLIATAYVQQLTLVTRDARIISFAKATPQYITVMNC